MPDPGRGGSGALLRLILDLCLLRRGPQDIPHSHALLNGLLLVAVGIDLLVLRLVGGGESGLLRIAVSLALTLAVPRIVLGLRGFPERYVQTLTALVAVGIVFTLVTLPLALQVADMPPPEFGQTPPRAQLLVGWAMLALLGALLAINGHIWRHALEWPRAAGLLLAAGLFIGELLVLHALFAPSTAS